MLGVGWLEYLRIYVNVVKHRPAALSFFKLSLCSWVILCFLGISRFILAVLFEDLFLIVFETFK